MLCVLFKDILASENLLLSFSIPNIHLNLCGQRRDLNNKNIKKFRCTNLYLKRGIIICWLCLVLIEASKGKFLGLCKEGDLETVKTMLAEDPSLSSCEDGWGKV